MSKNLNIDTNTPWRKGSIFKALDGEVTVQVLDRIGSGSIGEVLACNQVLSLVLYLFAMFLK